MQKLRPSFAFSIPPISNFTEINLRTYVKDKYNRKGVWFFSLIPKTHSVIGSLELFFHLNYRYAETEFLKNSDEQLTCKFTMPNTGTPEQSFSWQHTQDDFLPSKNPESLEFFLTERYRLFSY